MYGFPPSRTATLLGSALAAIHLALWPEPRLIGIDRVGDGGELTLIFLGTFEIALLGTCPLYRHAMHGVAFRGHERPRACSCQRRCRHHPLSILIEGLELSNGCDMLLVDADHGTGSQIFIQGAEATSLTWQRQ